MTDDDDAESDAYDDGRGDHGIGDGDSDDYDADDGGRDGDDDNRGGASDLKKFGAGTCGDDNGGCDNATSWPRIAALEDWGFLLRALPVGRRES